MFKFGKRGKNYKVAVQNSGMWMQSVYYCANLLGNTNITSPYQLDKFSL